MIEFYKMSGSGNDFILIDNTNRALPVKDWKEFARDVCRRKVSVGADGLIVIEKSDKADFRWLFFNADGSEADMCGNGARCAARFAVEKGIAPRELSFETKAGIIEAFVNEWTVKVRLTDPQGLRRESIALKNGTFTIESLNTGVPHAVLFVDDLDGFDVFNVGREIRFHRAFQPAGTNANFAKVVDRRTIRIRTYERGVEDETLACGTGAVASALISSASGRTESPVEVRVRSGETIRAFFERRGKDFEKVYLEGRAEIIYQGLLRDEAINSPA